METTLAHDAHFCFCGIVGTADDRTCVTHTTAGRRCLASNEAYNRLRIALLLNPAGCFCLVVTTDLTDHHDRVSLRVFHEHLYRLLGRSTNDRITTNTDGSRYTKASFNDLVGSFVSKRTRLRNDTDAAFLEDEAGHDAYFGLLWSDDARAVRTYEYALLLLDVHFGFHHISYRDTLGDTNNHFDTRLSSFHNRITCKCRGHEDDRNISASAVYSIFYGVENGTIEMRLASFAGSHTTYYVGTIFDHLTGVEGAFRTGKSLYDDFRIFID